MERDEWKKIIEALLFVSDKPLAIDTLREVVKDIDVSSVRTVVEELNVEYSTTGRSFQIKRGETVQVPAYVAEVLEQSMAQDNATANLIERESSAYAAEAKARNI